MQGAITGGKFRAETKTVEKNLWKNFINYLKLANIKGKDSSTSHVLYF